MSSDKPLPPDANTDRATKRRTAVSLVTQGVPRAEVAKTFRISVSTLDKWIARARRGGDAALADKRRNQVPIKYGGAKKQIDTIANKAKFRTMNVTEAASAIHRELHDPAYSLDNIPSVSTIYNWIRRTEKKVPSNSTAYEKSTAAGQVDQVDSTKLAHDVFDENGKLIGRGTVTVVVDAYTRYIKGYAFNLFGESVAQIAEALTHAFFFKESNPDWSSFKCAMVFVDNGSAHRSKAVNDALIERASKRFRLKFRAIGKPESGGIVERTLQTIEKRSSEHGGKPTLADVRSILTEVCQTFNHTVHSTLKTTPTMALAVSRSGSKHRPAVGRKLDPLPLEDRETFLLDLLRVIRTPQVRRSCIVFGNLTYRHPELADLHKEKVAIKVSPDRWRHFVYAYHPRKEKYLEVPLDYNASFAFTEAEVSEAVKAANLRGKKLSNRTVVDIIKEDMTKAPATQKGRRDKAQKDLAADPLRQEEQKKHNEPRKKVSFPKSVATLETGLTDE